MFLTKCWGDIVVCAAYLVNRMPLSSLKHTVPYAKLFQQSHLLNHLRIFGCLCYISTTNVHRSKFDPRAQTGVSIRYAVTHKGYKVYNLVTHKGVISRDVSFHERNFPFHLSNQTNPNPIFISSPTLDYFDDFYPDPVPPHTNTPTSNTEQPNLESSSASSFDPFFHNMSPSTSPGVSPGPTP